MAHGTLDLRVVAEPEIVIGLVGALGAPMEQIFSLLKEEFKSVRYVAELVRLSDYLHAYDNLETPAPAEKAPPDLRLNALMDRGNQLREKLDRGDALAMHAATHIHLQRPPKGPKSLERRAFILRQLKHPEEVLLLRRIYGDAFHLIGVYTPYKVRSKYLRDVVGINEIKTEALLARDAGEEFEFGQQVTKTFHLADLFLEALGLDDECVAATRSQIRRYLDLLFGRKIVTPSRREYGMFLASSVALRSADLSRQVGAAILSASDEGLGLGSNEVPAAGGGQYWGDGEGDRDVERGHDSNEVIKLECLEEVLEILDPDWGALTDEDRRERVEKASSTLDKTRLMNLTEFGRAVHAEMEAILSATRVGVSVKASVLYTTTFPCHNCAKHIVGSGIGRVVYIEPYSKSLADRLHRDAIAFTLEEEQKDDGRIPFSSFHGVAPRRFPRLFSSIEADGGRVPRKEKGGRVRTKPVGLRMAAAPLTHIDREGLVAQFLADEMKTLADFKGGEADE